MKIIINADDFGMFDSANRGILYSLEHKLINSVSVCVNYETSQNLTDILQYREQLISIGLHVNITEGFSLISNAKYPNSLTLYNERRSYKFYYEEIESQIKKFNLGFSFLPEHLDCHQHFAYFDENAYGAFVDLANKYNIAIRSTYSFSCKERVEEFFLHVSEKHGVKVPFDIEKIVSNINSLRARNRTMFVALNLNNSLVKLKKDNLEVVCHPQLSIRGEKNDDLKFMVGLKTRNFISFPPI